ncbi:hypothetical protein [Thermophagus xiamenensis]|uniref:Uncharacterized protein n=1 Tax=Thermophagus xiamenensis TaxID=385682 RepID=A0A1I1VE99_9BACT|nr:hypothetical protein [Thermophagus xiamenensis]SFD81382.1 hypothetical protein SAMN05444380_102148 [Thermophagus xiamenensis]
MSKKELIQEDQKWKQLFQNSFQPEKIPSPDFNKKVMDRVLHEWISQSEYFTPVVNKRNRFWIISGIVVVFIIGFFMDAGVFRQDGLQLLNNLNDSFRFLFSWIKPVHLIFVGTFLAVGLLLALDYFFRKLSNI